MDQQPRIVVCDRAEGGGKGPDEAPGGVDRHHPSRREERAGDAVTEEDKRELRNILLLIPCIPVIAWLVQLLLSAHIG